MWVVGGREAGVEIIGTRDVRGRRLLDVMREDADR
jgi:hypothetical protein